MQPTWSPNQSVVRLVGSPTSSSNISPRNKIFLRPKEIGEVLKICVVWDSYFIVCFHGLCSRMVGHFCMHTSTFASAVTTSWCWNSVQLCSTFWMSIVNVVMLDRVDIFSWMERYAMLSMSGPMNWYFSSSASSSLLIFGKIVSSLSRLSSACCTHWCAYLFSF